METLDPDKSVDALTSRTTMHKLLLPLALQEPLKRFRGIVSLNGISFLEVGVLTAAVGG
jgi:hypothetical protein